MTTDIRERLLSHWNHEKPGDLAIWDHNPATFRFELSAHPAQPEGTVGALLTMGSSNGKAPTLGMPHAATCRIT
jgi:hypothetical protein